MKSEQVENLLNHMMWADAEVWKKVIDSEAAESDERIKKLLYHIHQVQYAFYFLWNELPLSIPKPEEFSDLKSIAKWGFEYQQKLDEILSSSLSDEHSTYHRGQINTRFRELGGEPAMVDFIAWVWLGKPKSEWGEII